MPRSDHETTLARQWELLKLLPSRPPGKTARDLRDSLEAAGHSVTKRTVERDLGELSRLFSLRSNEVSKPYGWYWRSGARIDIPGMDLAEAVSLGLLENLLRQLVPPTLVEALEGRFSQAREKLRALPRNQYAKWSEIVRYVPPGLPFLPPAIKPEVLNVVHNALLLRRQLKVTYLRAGDASSKEFALHPVALIQQGERSYLLAGSSAREDPFYYAIHRMHAAELLDAPARRPKSFSLDDFLARGGAQFGNGEAITLKARVAGELALILRETPLSKDQTITTRAGRHTLTATVKDSWQLQFWILSSGPSITVLGPAALRKRIVSMLQDALANYSIPSRNGKRP